jgi:hypothetical protein
VIISSGISTHAIGSRATTIGRCVQGIAQCGMTHRAGRSSGRVATTRPLVIMVQRVRLRADRIAQHDACEAATPNDELHRWNCEVLSSLCDHHPSVWHHHPTGCECHLAARFRPTTSMRSTPICLSLCRYEVRGGAKADGARQRAERRCAACRISLANPPKTVARIAITPRTLKDAGCDDQ